MTDTSPEQDPATVQEPAPAPVRVPNVSAGAVSGIDHTPIGANAQEAHAANEALDAGLDPDTGEDLEPGLEVPAGSQEDRLAWVAEGEDEDTRGQRADAIYEHEKDAGTSTEDLEALAGLLREAVYGTPDEPEAEPDPTDPDAEADGGTAPEVPPADGTSPADPTETPQQGDPTA